MFELEYLSTTVFKHKTVVLRCVIKCRWKREKSVLTTDLLATRKDSIGSKLTGLTLVSYAAMSLRCNSGIYIPPVSGMLNILSLPEGNRVEGGKCEGKSQKWD